MRLFQVADPSFYSASNPLCVATWISSGEQMFSAHAWGDAGVPTLDQTIAMGFGFWIQWPAAFPQAVIDAANTGARNSAYVGMGVDGVPGVCDPCGPEFMDAFCSRVPGFVAAARKRTDACRARGLRSGFYLGDPGAAVNATPETLARWTQFVLDCGFDVVGCDVSAGLDQRGNKTPGTLWREFNAAYYPGRFRMAVESPQPVHPGLFPHYTGAYDMVGQPGEFQKPGLFPRNCWQTSYVVSNGGTPVATRQALLKQTPPANTTNVIDFAGLTLGAAKV